MDEPGRELSVIQVHRLIRRELLHSPIKIYKCSRFYDSKGH